jgi:hypothetical protein
MSFPAWELQKAAYSRVSGNLTNCPLHAEAPDNIDYPFALVTVLNAQPDNAKGCVGYVGTIVYDIYHSLGDSTGSMQTVSDIADNIKTLITTTYDESRSFLSPAGFTVIRQDFAGFRIDKDIFEKVIHGEIEFEIEVEEA